MSGLTPIYIRGKRYRSGLKCSQVRKQRHALKGSPLEDTLPQHTTLGPRTRRISRLESLPPEILQQIFFLCPNINLPAATLPLSYKLSSPSLKKDFFISLFLAEHNGNPATSSLHSAITTDLSASAGQFDPVYSTPTGDPKQVVCTLQIACLRLRWLTYPFIERIMRSLPVGPHSPPKDEIALQVLNLQPGVHLPPKLLHGPWTVEKGDFLDLLFRSGASIDYIDSTDAEVYSASLTDAIIAGDIRGVEMILRQGRWSSGGKIQVTRDYEYPSGVMVTTEHLRAAVLEGDCERMVVLALLLASDAKIDGSDKAIWDWIHNRKAEGDVNGTWLEEELRDWVAGRRGIYRR